MGVFTSTNNNTEKPETKGIHYYLKRIGVSVLFSGAAVGVSHVVQATRAGAEFSLALLPAILLCLTLKYPSFLFGPLYTRMTSESLVAGYARIGRWTLPLVAISFLGVMFTVVAAVALLASGIFIETMGISANSSWIAIGLVLVSTTTILYLPFERFQKAMKFTFLLLFLLSVGATVIALPTMSTEAFSFHIEFSALSNAQIFFIAALIGWMPAGLDLPMMHSQWLLAKGPEQGVADNAIEDFNFGYLSTTILAILFLFIGAIFFYGTGTNMSPSAGGFSKQLLNIYTTTLGPLGGLVMGTALFLAISSTLLVVIDGFPRVLSEVISRMLRASNQSMDSLSSRYRSLSAWAQAAGAILILIAFKSSLKELVDFATTLSFLLVPVFALLNHKTVSLEHFKKNYSLPSYFRYWSILGILFFTAFAAYYLFLKFLN